MTEIQGATGLYSQAAILMLVGMGFVFVFLAVLIAVIKLFLAPLGNRFPDPVVPEKKQQATSEAKTVVAAIAAAIKQYRTKHK